MTEERPEIPPPPPSADTPAAQAPASEMTPAADAIPAAAETEPTLETPAEPTVVQSGPNLWQRIWPYLEPHVHRSMTNLRVWVPFLANPRTRNRAVRFSATRDNRDGAAWRLELPKFCWKTGATENLRPRIFEVEHRSFESPLTIIGIAGGLALLFFLLALMFGWWKLLWAVLLSIIGGAIMLFVKSWKEEVQLTIWTSPEAADELRCPEMVIYENEVHMVLPTERIAEATRDMIVAERIRRREYSPTPQREAADSPPARAPESVPMSDAPPSRPAATPNPSDRVENRGYRREELPPIKLDE